MTIKYYGYEPPVLMKNNPFFLRAKYLVIQQIRSSIGLNDKQRGHLKALGLGKMHSSVVVPNNPAVRGKVYRVRHIVKIEMVDNTI